MRRTLCGATPLQRYTACKIHCKTAVLFQDTAPELRVISSVRAPSILSTRYQRQCPATFNTIARSRALAQRKWCNKCNDLCSTVSPRAHETHRDTYTTCACAFKCNASSLSQLSALTSAAGSYTSTDAQHFRDSYFTTNSKIHHASHSHQTLLERSSSLPLNSPSLRPYNRPTELRPLHRRRHEHLPD